MITGVHHVSYTVSSADRSIAFYRGLGFDVTSDRVLEGELPATVTGLAAGGTDVGLRIVHLSGHGIGLELIEYLTPRGAARAARTNDVGSSHLCFLVDDIDHEIDRLRAAGASFLSAPQTVEAGPNAGNRFVYFLDPDGIPMELSQPARRLRPRSG